MPEFVCISTGCEHTFRARGSFASCGCCVWFAWADKSMNWRRYYRDFTPECRAELEAYYGSEKSRA